MMINSKHHPDKTLQFAIMTAAMVEQEYEPAYQLKCTIQFSMPIA